MNFDQISLEEFEVARLKFEVSSIKELSPAITSNLKLQTSNLVHPLRSERKHYSIRRWIFFFIRCV